MKPETQELVDKRNKKAIKAIQELQKLPYSPEQRAIQVNQAYKAHNQINPNKKLIQLNKPVENVRNDENIEVSKSEKNKNETPNLVNVEEKPTQNSFQNSSHLTINPDYLFDNQDLFVVPPGIEPGTQGFSVLCSTN